MTGLRVVTGEGAQGVVLACSHVMCRPGSAECVQRELDEQARARTAGPGGNAAAGAFEAEVPAMHPTGRDLAKLTPAGVAAGRRVAESFGPMSRVVAGWSGPARPAITTTCCGGTNLQPHRPGCPSYRPVMDMVRRLDAELVQLLLDDARTQLDNVRGRARLFLHRAELIEQAEAGWRRDNPGLSWLLLMADGAG